MSFHSTDRAMDMAMSELMYVKLFYGTMPDPDLRDMDPYLYVHPHNVWWEQRYGESRWRPGGARLLPAPKWKVRDLVLDPSSATEAERRAGEDTARMLGLNPPIEWRGLGLHSCPHCGDPCSCLDKDCQHQCIADGTFVLDTDADWPVRRGGW